MNDEDHVLLSEKLEDQLKSCRVGAGTKEENNWMKKADVSQMHSWKR